MNIALLTFTSLLPWTCHSSPLYKDRLENPDQTALIQTQSSRQVTGFLFSQFLTSFPFILATPIQNIISWFWSFVIYGLIWVIIAVAAFKYFTRDKIKKLRAKKTGSQTNIQVPVTSPVVKTSTFTGLDANTLMACASCPLILPLLQGMGGMPYPQQTVSYVGQQAPVPQLPAFPDIPFPELPASPPPELVVPPDEELTSLTPAPPDTETLFAPSLPPPPENHIKIDKPEFSASSAMPINPVPFQTYPQHMYPYTYPVHNQGFMKPLYNPSRSGAGEFPESSLTKKTLSETLELR